MDVWSVVRGKVCKDSAYQAIELTQLIDWAFHWCLSIIDDSSINYWWIDGLINQWINFIDKLIKIFKNIFSNIFFFFKFSFFSKFCLLYNSSRTLGIQIKYLLSIDGSTLSWWKGEVDEALDPWSCLFFSIKALFFYYLCIDRFIDKFYMSFILSSIGALKFQMLAL